MFKATDTFLVLLPPGHIATLEADLAKEYIPALTADDGVTKMLAAFSLI